VDQDIEPLMTHPLERALLPVMLAQGKLAQPNRFEFGHPTTLATLFTADLPGFSLVGELVRIRQDDEAFADLRRTLGRAMRSLASSPGDQLAVADVQQRLEEELRPEVLRLERALKRSRIVTSFRSGVTRTTLQVLAGGAGGAAVGDLAGGVSGALAGGAAAIAHEYLSLRKFRALNKAMLSSYLGLMPMRSPES